MKLNNGKLTIDRYGSLISTAPSFVDAYCDDATDFVKNTWQTVIYNNAVTDYQSELNTTTGVFTAKEAGIYIVEWGILANTVDWDATEYWVAALVRNDNIPADDTDTINGLRWTCSNTSAHYAHSMGSIVWKLAASDNLRVKVYHNNGTDRDIYLGAASTYNIFKILKVA